MAGSRVGLFDNFNIPIHRDAQHREDRRLTEPHRTRTGRHAWRLSVGAWTGPLSNLQRTLHVVCSHAHGHPRPMRQSYVLAC
jgi:hypothetical protein